MENHDFDTEPVLKGTYIGAKDGFFQLRKTNGDVKMISSQPQLKRLGEIRKGTRVRVSRIDTEYRVEKAF